MLQDFIIHVYSFFFFFNFMDSNFVFIMCLYFCLQVVVLSSF